MIDSWRLAKYLDHRRLMLGEIMPVLRVINNGRESNETGGLPSNVDWIGGKVRQLDNPKLQDLMAGGPRFGEPENSRPYFVLIRSIFDWITGMNLPNVEMKYWSMGMNNSYQIAIEEGVNINRIGTRLLGERT